MAGLGRICFVFSGSSSILCHNQVQGIESVCREWDAEHFSLNTGTAWAACSYAKSRVDIQNWIKYMSVYFI